MAVDPNIKKKADDIRNKVYGKEVRESLASGLEEVSSDVVENEGRQSVVEGRQDSVESQWQVVSDEMTDKDVISAPEIIAARNGEANLKARLDKEKNEVTAQLAQTGEDVLGRVKLSKKIEGGQVPEPLRVPTLAVEESFPNARSPYLPMWVDGNVIYAFGEDNLIRKSTDSGSSWERRGYFVQGGLGAFDSFLKLESGTLLTINSARVIYRSTDDANSWSSVWKFREGAQPLGAQSWAVDENTGYIYIGEYIGGSETANLYRSVDDGQTWELFYEFPGIRTPIGTDKRITHIHAVQYDPYSKSVFICTGDSTPDTGLWRVQGDDLEKVVTNSMLSTEFFDAPRAIGIMTFPNYIAWASDSTTNPYIFRMARSEIGKDSPEIERIYRVNSTAWFSCRAGEKGNRWIISASQENLSHALDNMTHLYCVEDEGETVWEVGTIPASVTGLVSSIQPVGTPYQSGDVFYMITRLARKKSAWALRLGYSTTELRTAEPIEDVRVQQTISGGLIELKPKEEKVFGIAQAGGIGRRFNLYDFGVGGVTSSRGNVVVTIRERGEDDNMFTTTRDSQRYTNRAEMGTYMDRKLVTAGSRVEFVVRNIHEGETILVNPFVTFGWSV